MSALKSLETSLDDIFVKKAPALPENGKKNLVEYLPWINLFLGLLSLYTAYVLWNWANLANSYVDYANTLSAAYGSPAVAVQRLTVVVWVSLAVMALQAVLYLLAFPGLKARKKSGWDLMFYALLVNVLYGLVVMFSSYGTAGNLIGSIIGSAIGFYFLFQIRSHYTKASAPAK